MISDAKEGIERENNDPKALNNIITNYFQDKPLDSSIVEIFDNIDYKPTPYLFYGLPMALFCIESQIRNLMSSTS